MMQQEKENREEDTLISEAGLPCLPDPTLGQELQPVKLNLHSGNYGKLVQEELISTREVSHEMMILFPRRHRITHA